MKKNFVIFSLALLVSLMTFTSCQKDTLGIDELETIETPSVIEEEIEATPTFDSPNSFESADVLSISNASGQAISIVLTTAPCANEEGFSVTVSSADDDLNNGNFTIRWYKNSELDIYAEGQTTIECVCGAGFRVEVYDELGDLSAKGSLDVPSC
ncbi:MAG: hypothetical protein AAF573_17090 [Bacteroidota bacterium]